VLRVRGVEHRQAAVLGQPPDIHPVRGLVRRRINGEAEDVGRGERKVEDEHHRERDALGTPHAGERRRGSRGLCSLRVLGISCALCHVPGIAVQPRLPACCGSIAESGRPGRRPRPNRDSARSLYSVSGRSSVIRARRAAESSRSENGRRRTENRVSSGFSRYFSSGPGPQLALPRGATRGEARFRPGAPVHMYARPRRNPPAGSGAR